MAENHNGRWIMISDGTPQMMYAGKTALSEGELDDAIMMGRLIELNECRAMRTLLMPSPQGGITQNEIITPISCARTGVRIKLRVRAYLWPDQDAVLAETFLGQIKQAEDAEVQMRAARSGIVTAAAAKIGTGGKLLS
jgi:hypothetical protein